MSQSFGQYVRSLREKAGMTQRALSQVVGFRSLAHLSDIESGKRYPARETLTKFAGALGVSVAELESRDVRGPVEALKSLFSTRPEMIGAFLRLAELAQGMDAEELIRRVTAKSEAPVIRTPDPVVTPPQMAPVEKVAAAERLEPIAAPVAPPPPKPSVRKPPTEKPSVENQPSLF